MIGARRLQTLQSHLVNEFEFPYDSSLDEYRKRGVAFDQKQFFDTYFWIMPDLYAEIVKKMSLNPVMRHDYEENREKRQEKSLRQIISSIQSFKLLKTEEEKDDGHTYFTVSRALVSFDSGTAIRLGVHITLYLDTLFGLGTAKHQKLVTRCLNLLDYGCFGMTELGHGSNVVAIDTTATYHHESRSFILNSPVPESAKFWIGAAAKTANKAIIFAQLYLDNKNKGVHVFVVKIRDRKTHTVLDGVVLGDCGKKIGNDCIDNGFILFRNYRVPYDSLLDRLTSITPDGKYKSNIKNPDKRFAAQMRGLIGGRLSCLMNAESNARKALTIAIRYAAVRKQFSVGAAPERPIFDYSLHRFRLIPHLANTLAAQVATVRVEESFVENRQKIYDSPDCAEGEELHAILSAYKVLTTRYSQDAIQECREACGGLGYSAYAGLGHIRDNHDVNLTWEGDNNVLIQQSAKYVLKNYQRIFKGQKIDAKSLSYLNVDASTVTEARANFANKFDIIGNPQVLIKALEYRVNLLVLKSAIKLQENLSLASHPAEAWNMTQPFYLQDLAKAYGESTLLSEMYRQAESAPCPGTRSLMTRLTEVYALSKIYKSLGLFRESYLTVEQGNVIQDYLLEACVEVGESAVRIIDAIADPDELIGSVLGCADGQVYQRTMATIEAAPGCYTRPDWISLLQEHRANLKKQSHK